ncbi:hypothetical protein [Acinetobacter sp. WCHAc060025]|uniref:hypothetical protein n=1 Tax=Acinetobacter sp. WCHAc060025 TaxID=2518625 RepID=UPI0013EE9D69|nr:hypothetical protein [Acinetobacter sp. WCHAc060025]
MKKMILLLCSSLMLSLSACAVHTREGSIVVDPNGVYNDHRHGDGRFCPPGQAKKGNC